MREFVIDIKNLVVSHWGKLIFIFLFAYLILNFDNFKRGLLGKTPASLEAQVK